VRELDRTQVKGKQRAVNFYELIDSRDVPLDAATEDFLGLYAEAARERLHRDRHFAAGTAALSAGPATAPRSTKP
jgi:hypothetical protein